MAIIRCFDDFCEARSEVGLGGDGDRVSVGFDVFSRIAH